MLFQKGLGLIRQGVKAAQLHPLLRQLGQQALADPVALGQQAAGLIQHGGGLLGAGHAGFIVRHPQLERVHEHTHPDHIELVQVALENGGEIQPLTQGVGGVLRLLQHPLVELEPGQLPVDIAGRGGGRRAVRH